VPAAEDETVTRWLCPGCGRDWDQVVRNFWSSEMTRLQSACICGLDFAFERVGDDVFVVSGPWSTRSLLVSDGEGMAPPHPA